MSLRKRPAVTPELLAANARNARKSTGPRTGRGKVFSSLNGWKGGRPTSSSYPFEVSAGWQPDMSDPDFRRWVLAEMRENYPEAYALWIRSEAMQGKSLLGKQVAEKKRTPDEKGGPKKIKFQNRIVLKAKEIPASVSETNYRFSAKQSDKWHILRCASAMKTKTPVRRDLSALEGRRLRAARLLKRGLRPAEVARYLGVHRQSVGRWKEELDRRGFASLKKARRDGRPPKMTTEELLCLKEALLRGPRAWGYGTKLWTTQRVADLIERRFGVRYHRDHVGRLLAQMGWSYQRPMAAPRSVMKARVRRWRPVEWPRKKKPRKSW